MVAAAPAAARSPASTAITGQPNQNASSSSSAGG
jgi:hypothetical protein